MILLKAIQAIRARCHIQHIRTNLKVKGFLKLGVPSPRSRIRFLFCFSSVAKMTQSCHLSSSQKTYHMHGCVILVTLIKITVLVKVGKSKTLDELEQR